MSESTESLPVPARTGLFEINLLGDRVQRMHRRVRFFQVCSALALLMVVIGGALSAVAGRNVIGYVRARQGAHQAAVELAAAQNDAAALDLERKEACQALGSIGSLSSIARRRMAWAPKLTALAQALPAGGGILSVEAQSGDVFWQAPVPVAGKAPPGLALKPTALPAMKFSVLFPPTLGGPNLIQFLERLQHSDTFMKGMSGVHLDAAIQESWMGSPAMVLTGSCKGAEEVKP